jgi:ribosomal protein S7
MSVRRKGAFKLRAQVRDLRKLGKKKYFGPRRRFLRTASRRFRQRRKLLLYTPFKSREQVLRGYYRERYAQMAANRETGSFFIGKLFNRLGRRGKRFAAVAFLRRLKGELVNRDPRSYLQQALKKSAFPLRFNYRRRGRHILKIPTPLGLRRRYKLGVNYTGRALARSRGPFMARVQTGLMDLATYQGVVVQALTQDYRLAHLNFGYGFMLRRERRKLAQR